MAATPSLVTLVNTWLADAAATASIAPSTSPSVEFLIPIGIDSPLESWRCTWL
jgi:hypothetical protein